MAYILGECWSWEPVKLCQRWISAPLVLPCCRVLFLCAWVNCGSGGIPTPPGTCVFRLLFFNPHITLPFVRLFLITTPTHRPVVCSAQLLSSSFSRSLMRLLSCWIVCMITSLPLWDHFCHTFRFTLSRRWLVSVSVVVFTALLLAWLVALTTLNNIFYSALASEAEAGGVALWSVKLYMVAECCEDLARS